MTHQLEQLLGIAPELIEDAEPVIAEPIITTAIPVVSLQEKMQEYDKIAAALPQVTGLGEFTDTEFDELANKAEKAFDDLMDLGMNVEARYSTRMFEVAGTMLNTAVAAKSAKIDKKLKMIDLQLKKLAVDRKFSSKDSEEIDGEGYILTDRNSILEKIKNMKNL